jgi:hypothetical protein
MHQLVRYAQLHVVASLANLALLPLLQSGIHLVCLLQQQQQQQQQQYQLTHKQQQQLLLLPGPSSVSTLPPRCAAWLPHSRCADSSRAAASPVGLLAAWEHDLLLFTWEAACQGSGT